MQGVTIQHDNTHVLNWSMYNVVLSRWRMSTQICNVSHTYGCFTDKATLLGSQRNNQQLHQHKQSNHTWKPIVHTLKYHMIKKNKYDSTSSQHLVLLCPFYIIIWIYMYIYIYVYIYIYKHVHHKIVHRPGFSSKKVIDFTQPCARKAIKATKPDREKLLISTV